MTSSSPNSDWICGACSSPNKGGKYCTMCAAVCAKRQAVDAASAPNVAAVSAYALKPSKHPLGIILEVVGTASPYRGRSCKEHACCRSKVLHEDVVIPLCWEQIVVPDNIARKGKMKEETAITISWVLDGVDCCHVGFLPRTYIVQGVWQVADVFEKMIPPSCNERSGITTRGMRALL
jgi:hypothetical protein